MKSIRKHTMYLGNRIFGIVYVYLIGMLFLSACAEGERYINNEEESIVALEEVQVDNTKENNKLYIKKILQKQELLKMLLLN